MDEARAGARNVTEKSPGAKLSRRRRDAGWSAFTDEDFMRGSATDQIDPRG
jgi:hypothetical protein